MAFTFAAFCYMLTLVLCASLIFFVIWHVSPDRGRPQPPGPAGAITPGPPPRPPRAHHSRLAAPPPRPPRCPALPRLAAPPGPMRRPGIDPPFPLRAPHHLLSPP